MLTSDSYSSTTETVSLPEVQNHKREREVMDLLFQSMKNRDIADRLYVSSRTVDRHIENIYTKTGVNSRLILHAKMTE